VADWVCAGSSDFGYKNLAVFYQACNFDCSFCQNWHFRESLPGRRIPAEELAGKVDENTSCICFFGGDPTAQLPHSLLASQIAREWNQGKPLRVCWETNGSMNPQFLDRMLEISWESGGCIKFDLKSWSENLNIALCGVTNKQTLENFASAAACFDRRPVPPLLIASTLLVPGYVDLFEVEKLAGFIARLNPSIPYSLLAFHPEFMMKDLPATSVSHAQEAKKVALRAGLKNVRIGNVHLLKETYEV
jgi:pyruvate formate lyase activating enzyme